MGQSKSIIEMMGLGLMVEIGRLRPCELL